MCAVRGPVAGPGKRSVFLEAMDRGAWSFASASVAAKVDMDRGHYAAIELALGVFATAPWPIGDRLRTLIGEAPEEALITRGLCQAIDVQDTSLAMNGNRVPLTRWRGARC